MRAFLLAPAYAPLDNEAYPWNSYSSLLSHIAACMDMFGMPLTVLAPEKSKTDFECVVCVSEAALKESYADYSETKATLERNGFSPACAEFCRNARGHLERHGRPGDLVLCFHGKNHESGVPEGRGLVVLEVPGHTGHFAPFCAFPSHSFWTHEIASGRRRYLHYDAMIPHPVPDPGLPVTPDRGYLLFVGRGVFEKGFFLAQDVAKASGFPLVMAGQVDGTPPEGHVGTISPSRRDDLMRGAIALLAPNLITEPFGMVCAEALAVGCPVITTPWGGAAEIAGVSCHTLDDMVRAVHMCKDNLILRQECRNRYLERYSYQVVGAQLVAWMTRARMLSMGARDFYTVTPVRARRRAWCINMPERRDRRGFMQLMGRAESLDIVWIEGTRPECPWKDEDVQGNARAKHGCAVSHIAAWREFLLADEARGLFLEDDVFFAPVWREAMEGRGEDLVLLNAMGRGLEKGWNRASGCMLTGAYELSRRGAELLVGRFGGAPAVADDMLCWLQDNAEAAVHYPYLAMQLSGGSDIQREAHVQKVDAWFRRYMALNHEFYFGVPSGW